MTLTHSIINFLLYHTLLYLGIVTTFEFRTAHTGTEVYSGPIVKRFEDLKSYVQFHREFVRGMPDEMTIWMVVRHAPSRLAPEATAFPHRNTPFLLNLHTRWRDKEDDLDAIKWAKEFHDATRSYSQGVYVNFLGEEGPERVREAYTEKVWERLVAVKRKWDPENTFRMNQNISPFI